MIRGTPNNLRQTLFFSGASGERRRRRVTVFENQTGASSHKRGSKRGKGAVGEFSSSLLSHSFIPPFEPIALHSGLVPIFLI